MSCGSKTDLMRLMGPLIHVHVHACVYSHAHTHTHTHTHTHNYLPHIPHSPNTHTHTRMHVHPTNIIITHTHKPPPPPPSHVHIYCLCTRSCVLYYSLVSTHCHVCLYSLSSPVGGSWWASSLQVLLPVLWWCLSNAGCHWLHSSTGSGQGESCDQLPALSYMYVIRETVRMSSAL